MVLKFIDETQHRFIKTIFYGIDGSGKSQGAKIYCDSRNLHPVVIDFDYTNHTGLPRLECNWGTDMDVVKAIKEIIRDVESHPTYDTLIFDGVGTFNNLLLPKGKDSKRSYLVRTLNFKKIWKVLLHAKINVIFIGQKDMIVTEENESSKFAEMINNMVDYKFHCIHTGKGFSAADFTYVCTKTRGEIEPLIGTPIVAPAPKQETPVSPKTSLRQNEPIIKEKKDIAPVNHVEDTVDSVFRTADEIGEPKKEDDPIRNQCQQIKLMLERDGKLVNKVSMKMKVYQLIEDEILPAENEDVLIDYIVKHCPEELD